MAKLPEGMKQHRSQYQYGSTSYTYKGAKIEKYRDDYSLRVERLVSQSGRVSVEYQYASYRLVGVPASVEKFLADESYILDEVTGVFRLTESAKIELVEGIRDRVAKEIEAYEGKLAEYVAVKDWSKVSQYADHIIKMNQQYSWLNESEKAVA